MQEVSRARSTPESAGGRSEPQKLDPQYVVGFVDGEGCFTVSVSQRNSRSVEVRPMFEIELRDDDRPILERIRATLGCGNIYRLAYERYGWYPHAKLKVSNIVDLSQRVVPFFERYPLQAKKARVFEPFATIVKMVARGEHRTSQGLQRIRQLKEEHRRLIDRGAARVRENRSPGGVRRHVTISIPPVKSRKPVMLKDARRGVQGRTGDRG